MNVKIGIGYDVHAFGDGRKLILGGVEIPNNRGLKGHSDADVLLHSITDAILGAVALGDIGSHFPDSDPKFENADSYLLLKEAVQLVRSKGFEIGNVDSTIIAEQPKMQPYISAMQTRIAEALECSISNVSVKATTNEKLGAIGRLEGIAVHSVALISRV